MSRLPDISLVIPAFNEQNRLASTLRAVLAYIDSSPHRAELIVVDDGSTDSTRQVIASAAGADERIVPVLCDTNRGKGAAAKAGIARSRGSVVCYFDADLSYPLPTIDVALSHIEDGADVVIGARDLARRDGRLFYSPHRRAATVVFNALVETMLHLGIPDTQCGFKAFRGKVARFLFEELMVESFAFDIEVLLLARRWSLRIDRIPVHMTHVPGSSIRLFQDSLKMLKDVWKVSSKARRGLYPPRPAEI